MSKNQLCKDEVVQMLEDSDFSENESDAGSDESFDETMGALAHD